MDWRFKPKRFFKINCKRLFTQKVAYLLTKKKKRLRILLNKDILKNSTAIVVFFRLINLKLKFSRSIAKRLTLYNLRLPRNKLKPKNLVKLKTRCFVCLLTKQ